MSALPGAEEAPLRTGLMLVVFSAGDSFMAFDAAAVGELMRPPALTPVHGAPDYVMGVANLRGRILTVIDLERRLGLPRTAAQSDPRVLVMEEGGEAIGVYVPALADVIEAEELSPLGAELQGSDPELFLGVVERGGSLIAVLDPARSLAIP